MPHAPRCAATDARGRPASPPTPNFADPPPLRPAALNQACIDANDLEALKARVAELEFVNATATHGRELFPGLALGRRHGGVAARPSAKAGPVMSADASSFDLKGKVGVKTLEMLALNDDLNTVVSSNSYCTRRQAMARAAGLASGLSMAAVRAPPLRASPPPRLPSPPRPHPAPSRHPAPPRPP